MKRLLLVALGCGVLVGCIVAWRVAGSLVAPANHAVNFPADLQAHTIAITGVGHAIAASWRDLGGDTPVVLLVHGFRGDRASMAPRARLMAAAGYSTLLIDLQAHGETPGEVITLGWRESADVRAALAWLRTQAPRRKIGVIGVSLGGAAVLLGPQPVGFDAVVLEAVYPRIGRAVENRLRPRIGALAPAVAPLLLVQMRPRLGLWPAQLEPIRHIHQLAAPVLIVAGEHDMHTSLAESTALFEAANQPRGMWVVRGAVHQDFSRFDPAGYQANVIAFLDRHLR